MKEMNYLSGSHSIQTADSKMDQPSDTLVFFQRFLYTFIDKGIKSKVSSRTSIMRYLTGKYVITKEDSEYTMKRFNEMLNEQPFRELGKLVVYDDPIVPWNRFMQNFIKDVEADMTLDWMCIHLPILDGLFDMYMKDENDGRLREVYQLTAQQFKNLMRFPPFKEEENVTDLH